MEGLIGSCPAIEALRADIRRLISRIEGASRLPNVLIQGETGAGKGLVASALRRKGPRARGPFVEVNCAAIPETLLEAELFGYERGAFTDARRAKPGLFQMAHRGTLFLDEIALMPEALQAKLLKALEERAVRRLGGTENEAVDAWVISATNVDLPGAVKARRFREDLYQRLAAITLALPPLRQRGNDVIALAEHFLARACADYQLPARSLAPDARARLLSYRWPGNVRELANTMERAALLADAPRVTAAMLDLREAAVERLRGPGTGSLDLALRERVQAVLDQTGWNISQSAALLGITRNTLRSRIQKLGLRRDGSSQTPAGTDPVAVPGTESISAPGLAPGDAAPPVPGLPPRGGAPPVPGLPAGDAAPPVPDLAPEGIAPSRPTPRPAAVAPARPALPETDVGASAAPAVVSLRWERRLITVFGAVLAGPDDDASPLPFAAALGQLIAKLRTFGARIEEVTPNRIVAVFGFEPTEDGPRRAAHAALAMLKALDRMEGGPGPPLTGRFAIHVCRCLIAQAGDVAGMDDADRRAAWSALDALIGRARPQSVLVGAAGARFLERRFTLEPAEDIAGAHEAAYRVVGHERRGFEVGGVALSRFVGRARDLAVLHEYLRRVEDGRGQVVGILGEPGVGKSRLLHEFRESLDPGRVRHIEGRCLSYGSTIPCLPIIDIVRTSFGVLESDAADVTADKVRAGLQAMGLDVEASAPYLLHLLGAREGAEAVSRLEPDAVKARTMSVLRQMGVAGSRERPVILAVEDLQWIDPTSEEVLASLSEGLASYPLMLIATYRPGYRPPWLGRSYASQIALGRLTPGDSLAVVHSVASERELAPGLAQMIVTHADGVPFFLEELARAVTEHADLRTGVTVPDTIQGVLEARLDRLPAGEKLLLQTASVIGKDVPMPLLQSVADIPEADLRTSLAHLQAAEFIHLRQVSPAEEYTFKHALTHEAAYGSMLEAPRRQLHARVAEALERLHPDTRERQPELLARHYTSADLRPQAIACWQLAGQRAIRRSASAEAIAHLRSGLGLLAGLPDARARAPQELMLRLALGQAQVMAHGYGAPDVGETLARAHELSRQVGDSHQAFPLLFGLWRFYLARADLPAALGLAEQLLAVARRQGDPMLLTAGNIAVAVPRFYRGELAAARAHLEQAYATYRPEHTAPQAVAYGQDLGVGALAFLGWTLGLLGYRDQGLATSERAVALARTAAHPFSLALALLLAGWVRHLRGEVEAMGQLGEEELALSREQAFPFFLAGGLDLTGAALVARGETDAGLARMREGARIYRAAGVEVGLVHLAHLAEVLVDTGHVDEALAVVADALGRAPASGEGVYRAELYRIKGLALSRRDDREGAAACFRDAIALARQQEARVFELRAATSLAEIDLQGSSPALDAGLAACSAWFTEGLDLADQRAARALLSARSARPSPA